MTRFKITCLGCGQNWTVANTFSLYEQQAIESCPCPRCGAYTLCCHEPAEYRPIEKSQPVSGWRATPVQH